MKRFMRKLFKVAPWGVAVLAVALLVAHFAWKYSGNSQWELIRDQKGVKVYTMKVPGETIERFKATTRVKTPLDRAVLAMVSTDTEDCAEWMPGCTSQGAIQPWNRADLTYTHKFRIDLPSPFSPRDFIVHGKVTQNSVDKSVLVKFDAVKNLPENACCVRVDLIDNHWRFTPAENGEVEVEVQVHADQKLPYFMINKFSPQGLYIMCRHLQKFLDKEKWQQAHLDNIVEQ